MKMRSRHFLDRYSAPHTQLGLSLVELMIALVIGLFLVAGAITVYLQTGNTYKTSDKVARLQEVGRYALDVIEPDVRLAGMWGITNRSDSGAVENTVPDTDISPNCGVNWLAEEDTTANYIKYIDGRDGTDLSAVVACNSTSPVPAGVDALIVRRAEDAVSAVNGSAVQIQSSRTAAKIFKATAIPADMDPLNTETHNFVMRAYYVNQPTAGAFAGQSVLVRRTLAAGANAAAAATFNEEDVIPGIEDLQVQFGIDQDGDSSADKYVDPGAPTVGFRIVSVRIWIMVVAEDREAGFQDPATYTYANRAFPAFSDGKRRIVMTKTIRLRNARIV